MVISHTCRTEQKVDGTYSYLSDKFNEYKEISIETLRRMHEQIHTFLQKGTFPYTSIKESTNQLLNPNAQVSTSFVLLQDTVLLARRYAIEYLNVYKRVNGLPEYTFSQGAALLLNGSVLYKEVTQLQSNDNSLLWCDEFNGTF